MPNDPMTFTVEDAEIVFLNFAGKASQYNKEGDRNFCCLLDEKTADAMAKDGWNIKVLKPREAEEGEEGRPYIQVTAKFDIRPPKIVMITSNARTHLDQQSVEVLDYADIKKVDFIANAYEWTVGDKTGIKAYLKTMFVTIEEDELERKYANMGLGED